MKLKSFKDILGIGDKLFQEISCASEYFSVEHFFRVFDLEKFRQVVFLTVRFLRFAATPRP